MSQYLMYAQTAENVSERRIASARLMNAVSAALIAALGVGPSGDAFFIYAFIISIVGSLIACLAHLLISSHRELNRIKYLIIHEFEKEMMAQPFTREWDLLELSSYVQLTQIERWIPVAFGVVHLFIAVYSLIGISTSWDLPAL